MWRDLADTVIGAFTQVLIFLHDLVALVPFLEPAAWGWAIVLLTLIVRVLLLPLAIKQTRSMRAMQKLQPQLKELQKKYKVDRSLMRKDPEQYRAKRQKLNEEMMALYQREGANPAASCLPLLAQAPIFIALFWTLQRSRDLIGAEFYFFTAVGEGGLEMIVRNAGWPGWLLILLMSGTMFWSQKQMMARNAAQMADNPMAQQQKILLYVMPVFLAVISFNFPMGVLLYWVTTNFWQVAQQAIILREVQHEAEDERQAPDARPAGGTPSGPSKGATSGKQKPGRADRSEGGQDGDGTADRTKKPKNDPSGKQRPGRTDGGDAGSDGADRTKTSKGDPAEPGSSSPKKKGRQPRDKGATSANGDATAKPPRSRGNGQRKKGDHIPRRGDRR